MKKFRSKKTRLTAILLFLLFSVIPVGIIQAQQKFSFGIHADPVISWFSTDIKEVRNSGARPGFNFGLTFNNYFSSNYSFSTGISIAVSYTHLRAHETRHDLVC